MSGPVAHTTTKQKQPSAPNAAAFRTLFFETENVRWEMRGDYDRDLLADLLANPDAHLKNPKLLFKSSRVVTVGRIPATNRRTALVLRRLNYGKLRHRLRDCFRPSRARRAFRTGLMLEKAGIATAKVIAAGERRVGRWPVTAYLLTEEIVGANTLVQLIRPKWRMPLKVLHALADLLADLHQAGFSHQDLKAPNILFNSAGEPTLIDLDGVRHFCILSERRAVADLSRLLKGVLIFTKVPLKVQVRFLRRYLRRRRLAASVREIGARTLAQLRRATEHDASSP